MKLFLNRIIGRGSHGIVYQGVYKGRDVAVKKIQRSHDIVHIHHELELMHTFKHKNIVEYYDFVVEPKHVYVIMELVEGENATNLLSERKSEETLRIWVQTLVQCLQEIHTKGYIYNDMKPSNIMVNEDQTLIKLVDMGSTILVPTENILMKPLGTPLFFAPEKLAWNYGIESDVWSLGITLYMLITGKHPFVSGSIGIESLSELEYKIAMCPITFPKTLWNGYSIGLIDLISKLLERDVEKRITLDEILRHPWVSQRLF